ncbi:MAG: lytic transglycosylase domain-containing protein [Deltaproteobacteria bacterium]|nr:lytic transglycosylase domain-containing protein [Deltaproteobacteria bacterium]
MKDAFLGFSLLLLTLGHSASANQSDFKEVIRSAALRSLLDSKLIEAVITVESNFRPNAKSEKGAMGLMQVTPRTADQCEIHHPYHAANNVMGAAECLRKLINRYKGNLKLALAAYNAGQTAVDKYRGIPPYPETQNYVAKVLALYKKLKSKG